MGTMGKDKEIQMRLIDGKADGLRLCNCVGSSITTVYIPRKRLNYVKQTELPMCGIYFLFRVKNGIIQEEYIGSTSECIQRLIDNDSEKKWWDLAVVFLLNDENSFTLDIINGLKEYAINEKMKSIPNILKNEDKPSSHFVNSQKSLIENLYHEIELMLNVLSLNFYPQAYLKNDIFTITKPGIVAKGQYSGGKSGSVTVLAGSNIKIARPPLANKSVTNLRKELIDDGTLQIQDDGTATLTKDVEFSSPSGAAVFVLGGSQDGRDAWKSKDGKSIKEIWD